VDAIDEQCRQHDKNYGFRNVDSGDVEGKANMWSRAGWLASADADEQLRASVEAEMDANPSAYSPSARLYGQGIKGIFGGRARGAEAYNWGSQRYGEAEAGVEGAYNDASSFLSDRSALGSELVGSNVAGAQSFAESTVGRAGAGISSFLSSASGWSSAGDVAGGLFGGARDALSFIGESQLEGLTRAAGGLGELAGFAGDTLVSGGTGAWGALGRGATFASQTLGEAAVGGGRALLDAAEWKGETEQAIGDVGLDLLGRGARSVGEAVTGLSPRDIAGPLLAPNPVQEWIKGWF
jgi:hypothetical protein